MKRPQGSDTVSADYPVIVLVVLILLPVCFLFFRNWDSLDSLKRLALPVILVLAFYALWDSSQSFVLNEFGMKRYRLGKLTQEIPWDQVAQIGITTRQDGLKGSTQPFILIVLKGWESYDPNMDQAYRFISRNKGGVITINYIKRNAPLFEKHYGSFDFDMTRNG